ncbi:MAG: hypothetical protein U0270_12845 [Labilithrix sp.]
MRSRRGLSLLLLALNACVTPARIHIPTDASIAPTAAPPLVIGDQERSRENPFRDGAIVPCKDDEDRDGARKAIASVSAEVDRLNDFSPRADVQRVQDHIRAILDTPCLELAKADLREPLEFDSGLSLRTWWGRDDGERSLHLRVAKEDNDTPVIVLAGQPRTSLVLTGHEDHPLAPLLCGPSDGYECGRETAGWIHRTEPAFKQYSDEREKVDCEKTSLDEDPEARWSALVDCAFEQAPKEAAFPLGRFRAMKDGYFVISQPYGSGCARLDLYDLASGTEIRTSTCGTTRTTVGRAPLVTMREAAWMMTFATYARDNLRGPTSAVIPERVMPGRPHGGDEPPTHIRLGSIHSRPHSLWTWYRPKNGKLVAQLTGSTTGGSYAATSYARDLLRMVDESFVPGCAPAFSSASLAAIPWTDTGPMAAEGATMPFDFRSSDLEAARTAIRAARTPPKCTEPM